MFKNLTIRFISIYISAVVSLVLFLIAILLFFIGPYGIPLWKMLVYFLGVMVTTYVMVSFLVERYIFRKIKLIYKIISGSKDSLEDTGEILATTTMEDIDDKVQAWTAQTQDEITSLKSLENYRKRYLGDVSHELKTPLFSISGYLYTLLEGGLYDDKINKNYLNRALQNVERLQAIVEDLEQINQLDDPSGLNQTYFDLKGLVIDVFQDLELKSKEKNITLGFKPGADREVKVYADKDQIKQVLINLLNNSIKYGKEGGRTKVSFYDMDERMLVEVSDNGLGIDEKDVKHIFDRFYRTDKSRSRQEGGSGLGLSIVKHILEAHNQNITVRSTPGKGSTFGFTLAKKKRILL